MKHDQNGNITGYKARFVAHRFTQQEGIDYFTDDTFSAIAKLASACLLLALAACNNWIVHQVDVKSTYLYGKLQDNKEIYVGFAPSTHLVWTQTGQQTLVHRAAAHP
jgi:hypothetical protein